VEATLGIEPGYRALRTPGSDAKALVNAIFAPVSNRLGHVPGADRTNSLRTIPAEQALYSIVVQGRI
jgi:hypothetical protein